MVNVTELNRGPDISANEIDAASVIADDYNDGAIDHDQTSNRTHSGDDLSPNEIDAASVSATEQVSVDGASGDFDVEYLGVYQSESDLPDGNNPAIAFVVDENVFATRGI